MTTKSARICGIYRITCSITGKFYIGSAANMQTRWAGHRSYLSRGKHHSKHLQYAWSKYGPDVFIFEVIEACQGEQLLRAKERGHWL